MASRAPAVERMSVGHSRARREPAQPESMVSTDVACLDAGTLMAAIGARR